MKTFHFITGMPFSGSTLLSSILHQNPRFDAAMPGGILDAVYILTKAWPQIPEFQSAPNEPGKLNVMRSILSGYYADSSRPVIFDRSRSWIAHLETAELLIGGGGKKAKVLVPVRDIREILSSLELLWRQTAGYHQSLLDQKLYIEFQSIDGRCAAWLRPDSTIGLPYSRIEDAIHRGFRDRLHFVPYEKLTTKPEETLAAIYQFLEEPPFTHDFKNIVQCGPESDPVYDYPQAHKIRPALALVPLRAPQVLGQSADRYKGPFIWDTKK